MSAEEFAADLKAARGAVEGCTGGAVAGYRAPRWTLGGVPGAGRRGRASGMVAAAADVLIREGFLYDSSLAPIVHIGDPDWPRHPLAHYGGLSGCRAKLQELLRGAAWSPARDYVGARGDRPNRAASIARSVPSTRPSASTSAAGA